MQTQVWWQIWPTLRFGGEWGGQTLLIALTSSLSSSSSSSWIRKIFTKDFGIVFWLVPSYQVFISVDYICHRRNYIFDVKIKMLQLLPVRSLTKVPSFRLWINIFHVPFLLTAIGVRYNLRRKEKSTFCAPPPPKGLSFKKEYEEIEKLISHFKFWAVAKCELNQDQYFAANAGAGPPLGPPGASQPTAYLMLRWYKVLLNRESCSKSLRPECQIWDPKKTADWE